MSKIEFEPTDNKVGCFIYTNLKEVKKEQIDEIKKLLNKYGVLFFKNQSLNPEQYVNFSSYFGTPAKYPMLKPHKDFKDIYVIERKDKKFKYLFDKCDEVVYENYDKKLISHQIYIIKYFEGDYIKRHNDNWQTETSQGRLLSLVSQMTHPNLYEGGDTLVYNGDDTIKLSKEQGSTIIFPSSMDHELTKITKGERFSFVVMFKESIGKVVI